ncbi:MAG TPA: 5'/3'-nucleotidase SurE [Candidatus Baltobacteraceae bacterium]|jgi:5'-nucleotidase|nr:5'/3'-nucleotidase SurE [Candidatus Baltobacteraceae bacterium]
MSAPRILVVNDDGYQSPGIVTVARALSRLGEVTVVAPNDDRTGAAHSISAYDPVRIVEVPNDGVRMYACSGTPADCAVIGILDLVGARPDLLVSGINRGPNLGDDVNYSGTVAAAVEGTWIGIPSIAVSLAASWPMHATVHYWETAVDAAIDTAREVLRDGLPSGTLLNVNVPNVASEELHGVRWTRLGRKIYRDRLDSRSDPRGGRYYWFRWEAFDTEELEPGTDFAAIRETAVSITPLSIQRTDAGMLSCRQPLATSP